MFFFAREAHEKIRAESFDSALSRFPGRVLLSRDAFGHSTIGAEGLNCRVRDGNGCFTFAMATGNFMNSLMRALKLRLLNVGSSNVLSSLVCDSTFAVPSG